ncbi:MAG: MarR family winged helix-turn-helix transcriptional regulator [Chloroflexota bacterium]|jgi:DNA-binding MarR family transcriptional regulator|nr:MarR family winged helix-turn-helix transcriptional regulator [Chloroflexota bacterium]MDH5242740.1 MarR family winged helix-turn-helix transcriptional regulator [Chloroflexota bacterium]
MRSSGATETAVVDSGPKSHDDRPDRAQQILVLLGAFGHRTHQALAKQFTEQDVVTNAHVLAVCELSLRGPLRPRDLQASGALTSGGTTKLLDRLEELGLVERAYGRVAGDRRGITVFLTPRGHEAAARMSAALEGQIEVVRAFSAELAALLED